MKVILFCLLATAVHATEGIHFFESKVKPIFEQHCNKCHNEKKEKGGLRLDIIEGILHGGDSGKIIDYHNVDKSSLLIAVKRLDEDIEMPPKNSLPAADIATLEKWVKMGAPMPKSKNKVDLGKGYDWQKELQHWAYQKPKKSGKSIDGFIDSDLKKHNLKANAQATKVELIRRASFDLIGLPPTPEETEVFLSDKSPKAFEKLIDRLLNSPHFGERWARHWLDVARYGDDQPYAFQQKKLHSAWKYRDWVVKAYNEDLPYTEFIRRQLAADLISGLTPAENAATGLISTGPMYFKRTEVQKALADELDDRVDVVSKAFMGLTVSCARCHDHKFDAIPTKDYYSMAGVFKSTRTYDRFVASDEEVAEYHQKLLNYGNIKNRLKELYLKSKFKVLSKVSPLFSSDLITNRSRDHRGLVEFDISGKKELYLVVQNKETQKYKFHFTAWINPVLIDDNKTLKLSTLKPEVVFNDNKYYGAKFDTGEDAIIVDGEVINHGLHMSGTTVLKFQIPAGNWQKFKAEVGVFCKNGGQEKTNGAIFNVFDKNLMSWLEDQKKINKDEYLKADITKMSSTDAFEYKSLIKKLKTEKPKTPALVHALWEGDIRDMKINIRGNPNKFGEVAPRGYLSALNNGESLNFKNGSGRLELANLIASKENPLTARVMVNRIWHNLFGKGIVTSPSNFGKLGDTPSNQQLLDWLAVEFMENNWSVKKMIKTVMLSKVYKRSSQDNETNAALDGDNKYLWRQNLKRMDAEALRDSILKVAGKLHGSIGGSPSGSSFASTKFNRRMLYAKVSRTAPDSMRATFDFPSAANSAPKRNLTTVPQQKLFYLNSEFIMTMAKSLDKRLKSYNENKTKQLEYVFRLLYSRKPNQPEMSKLKPLIESDSKTRELLAQALLISNEFSYID